MRRMDDIQDDIGKHVGYIKDCCEREKKSEAAFPKLTEYVIDFNANTAYYLLMSLLCYIVYTHLV